MSSYEHRSPVPEGSIGNANTRGRSTRDTWWALYVPMPILKALYHVTPNRVLAVGSAAAIQIQC
jgi:N-methylhydantoinase B